MKTILVICYVCCTFVADGLTFSITPRDKGTFVEAPEWIKKTLLFKLLLKDGSIKVAEQHISKKEGENDPMKDMTAEGKSEEASKEREAEVDKIAGIDEKAPEGENTEAAPETAPETAPEAAPEVAQEKPKKETKPKKTTKATKKDADAE